MANISRYDPDRHCYLARGMAIQGATLAELAAGLGVSESTVTRWLREHFDFAEAVAFGRDAADSRVVESLYRQACSGNVTACIWWLKNRRPAEWRDRQEVMQEISVPAEPGAARAKLLEALCGMGYDPQAGAQEFADRMQVLAARGADATESDE